jgi:hypothetical protein
MTSNLYRYGQRRHSSGAAHRHLSESLNSRHYNSTLARKSIYPRTRARHQSMHPPPSPLTILRYVPPSRRAVSNAPKGGDLLRRSRKTRHSARRRSIRPPRDRAHLFSHWEPDGGASPESPLFVCGFFTVLVLETTRAYL